MAAPEKPFEMKKQDLHNPTLQTLQSGNFTKQLQIAIKRIKSLISFYLLQCLLKR